MSGRPQKSEAASFYWKYIDQVEGDDPIAALEAQLADVMGVLEGITEQRSTYRYAAEKWSIKQSLNHITDTERAFAYRAMWIGRGFTGPLESLNDEVAAEGAEADLVEWAAHVEEFRLVRLATIQLFRNMPEAAWRRSGMVGGSSISVRALAFVAAGHAAHHTTILRERYLK
jgi:hypothetical protein